MSIEKMPQPFPTFFIPIAYFVAALAFILVLAGGLLFALLPGLFIAAAMMVGVGVFFSILLGIHYAIYSNEWEATTALRVIENKLPELINIASPRNGQMYRPRLMPTKENISSFFATLEECVGKSGRAGARIVSIQAMKSLAYIFAFTNDRMYFDGELLTKEELTVGMELLDKLLDLLRCSFTLYHHYPSDFENTLLDRLYQNIQYPPLKIDHWTKLESNLCDLSEELIKLVEKRMFLFSIERDKPGEINQGEVNHCKIPINKIIKLLFLIYPAVYDERKIAILDCLISLPEKNLADHPSFGGYYFKTIPENIKSEIVNETVSEMKIAQQIISKELQALKDADQIPNEQVNAVNNLLTKHPAERELSFGNEPFSTSSSRPTETDAGQELKNPKNFSQSS